MHNIGSTLLTGVDLNSPGRYLHWSIFIVSEANLALIGVMVVIFGAALIIPFPGRKRNRQTSKETSSAPAVSPPTAFDLGDESDAAMWTSRVRRLALRLLPPGKLLPDRQPAYVASWIYVFGVAS